MACLKVFTRFFSTPRSRVGATLRLAILLACALSAGGAAVGQQYGPDLYSGMRWRLIGPFRAGRVTAVAGILGRPAVYYMATPGGGVWKTTNGGLVWKPIFDDARVASVGALALAPSNPEIIYVGTGEQTEGDGVYKSTDGGATWTNIGLRETHYITSIIVDPNDPNVVLVGAFGDQTPSQARGVFKTNDGGKTWKQTLFPGDRTSIADMCAAPGDRRTLYAATWPIRVGPGERQTESQIFKSTDAGETWHQLSGAGLPEKSRGRIGVVVAPGDSRVYAIMNQGFFRSDDAGETWKQVTTDPRVVGSGYFSRVFVDPKDADVVYVMQTSMYRSTDGGKTFEAYKGAPSGEDEHVLWIAPDDPRRMILGSDQGATVSLDGGQTWSIWYNQPTGQFYHVITDNQFPYYAYASQQDSGSVAVPVRSDFGQITFRDWFSTNAQLTEKPAAQLARAGHAEEKEEGEEEGEGGQQRSEQGVILSIEPSAVQAGEIWVGTSSSQVQLTRDGGSTWRNVAPPEMPANSRVTSIEASSLDADTAYAVASARGDLHPYIYRTRDGGKTWQKIVAGLPEIGRASVGKECRSRWLQGEQNK